MFVDVQAAVLDAGDLILDEDVDEELDRRAGEVPCDGGLVAVLEGAGQLVIVAVIRDAGLGGSAT